MQANKLVGLRLDMIKREDLPAAAATVKRLVEELENLSISYNSGAKDLYSACEEALNNSRKVHDALISRITNPGKLLLSSIEDLAKLYGKQ